MLYSKANLEVASVASTNPFDGSLNGVQFDPDGATIACDGAGLVAVGPTKAETHFPDVGTRGNPGENGIVLKPDFVSEIKTIIPKDKRVSLQHVAMTVGKDPSKTEFTTIDKSGRVRRIAEWPKRERYQDWRLVVQKALTTRDGSAPIRVCVGRKTLFTVLKTLVDACPDTGDAPIFLEIGSGVVLRSANRQTGQHVIGVAASYATGNQWMEKDNWEETINTENEENVEKRPESFHKKRKLLKITKK
jgi:hypothetical protein